MKAYNPNKEILKGSSKLPHWEQDGVAYFITFRLADSLPQKLLHKLKVEKEKWLNQHPKPRSAETDQEYHKLFSAKIEQWNDQGHGACELKSPEVREILKRKLVSTVQENGTLYSFVIMPNHVHFCATVPKGELSTTMMKLKGGSAVEINRHLKRTGSLWQRDYFDRMIRDQRHFQRVLRYIAANPKNLRPEHFTLWITT